MVLNTSSIPRPASATGIDEDFGVVVDVSPADMNESELKEVRGCGSCSL